MSDDCFDTPNVSWKPFRFPAVTVTWAPVRARITSGGTGSATTEPISSVRLKELAIGSSRDARRKGDAQAAARDGGEVVGSRRPIGVADLPEQLRVADRLGGHVVEAVGRIDEIGAEQRQFVRLGEE